MTTKEGEIRRELCEQNKLGFVRISTYESNPFSNWPSLPFSLILPYVTELNVISEY